MTQSTSHIFMVRPSEFAYNVETAVNNAFQTLDPSMNHLEIAEQAKREFDDFVDLLRFHKVDVIVFEDDDEVHTPDAVFPNNWITMHRDATVITYPMYAVNRRMERRQEFMGAISERFQVKKHIHLEVAEDKEMYLEGTGSIVFDHLNRLAYACMSERTHPTLLKELCKLLEYKPVMFRATDATNTPIYHTNVMMTIGTDYAVLCSEVIRDDNELNTVLSSLRNSGKKIVEISQHQMTNFAGNMIELSNTEGKRLLIMSGQAYQSLNSAQIVALEKYVQLVNTDIDTIETYGGGSARCMIAEIFLPLK